MEVKGVDWDGYCFLNAVVKVLEENFSTVITVEQAMEQVMKYVCLNYDRYTKYHAQGEKDLEPTIADILIADMIDFFSSRNFNQNIVDLLSQITVDVLSLELHIYQNNQGQIQKFRFTGCDKPMRLVQLKFTHYDLHPQGNDYKAIIYQKKKSTPQPATYSEVVKSLEDGTFKHPILCGIKKVPEVNILENEIFIDLTDDDNDIVQPSPPRCRRFSGGAGNSSSAEWSDETYIWSD